MGNNLNISSCINVLTNDRVQCKFTLAHDNAMDALLLDEVLISNLNGTNDYVYVNTVHGTLISLFGEVMVRSGNFSLPDKETCYTCFELLKSLSLVYGSGILSVELNRYKMEDQRIFTWLKSNLTYQTTDGDLDWYVYSSP